MALPRKVIDTESVLGVDNGAIQSAIPLGIAPGANEIVYVDGVIGDGSFSDPFSGGDFDYYSVYIAANTSITAAVYGSQWGTGLDAKIDFFSVNGLPVSSNDDYGSVDPLNGAFRATGGIYIIRVSHFNNAQSSVFDPASGDSNRPLEPHSYRLYIGTGASGFNINPDDPTTVTGDGNANIIDGGRNADIINGGDGDDVLNGGYGNDSVTGGIGNDTFLWNIDSAAAQTDNYFLDTGGDEMIDIHSPLAANTIAFVNNQFVTSGDDTLSIFGNSNSYTVNIYGGSGIDSISTSGITLGNCRTNIFGGAGDDVLLGSGGARMVLSGGEGADTLITGSIVPNFGLLDMVGGNGNDTYVITNASVFIAEGTGQGSADRVKAGVNFGLINSSSSAQIEFLETTNATGVSTIDLTGNAFAQTITGNAGMNRLEGGVDFLIDTLIGLAGNDTYVLGASTNDTVTDIAGIDKIESSITRSLASFATIENLTLTGALAINGTGNALANTIKGNGAANILNGGLGKDVLTGGLGNDAFVFNTAPNVTTNRDTITDFNVVNDTIRLENAIFNKLVGAGNTTLSAAQFHSGAGVTTAHDLDDRIIYNSTNGALYYDADGNLAGGVAAIQFATLSNAVKPVLTNADFLII